MRFSAYIQYSLAVCLCFLLIPFFVILSILQLFKMGFPLVFRQQRTGLNGKLFTFYKWRTMNEAKDAEGRLLPDEKRLTPYGAFLRRYSLDELPSLSNVLKGDMTLVGPRPLLPEYLPLYSADQRRRLDVKPGITGLAQIQGRNALSWEEKFAYDVEYVEQQSLGLDIWILFKTLTYVLSAQDTHHKGHVTMPQFEGSSLLTLAPEQVERMIYLSPPSLVGTELALIQEALESGYICPLGPMVDRFEEAFGALIGYPHCLAVSSGTAALHLALDVLGVQKGDVVWSSTLTFVAGVSPALFCGASLVFLDVSPETWTLDGDLVEEQLEKASQHNTLPKAIIATDLYGQMCDYQRLAMLCQAKGVFLIADCAESLGATYKNKTHLLPYVDAAIFSFNGNKIITTSGGGMLAMRSVSLLEKARYLSQQAKSPVPYYHHEAIGYNYRLSNLLAAVGVAQLADLPARVAHKKAIYETYQQAFQGIPGVEMMPLAPYGSPNYWLSVLTLDSDKLPPPETIRQRLEAEKIEARRVWKPMHHQPVFQNTPIVGGSVSDALFEKGLCLPSGTSLTPADQQRVIRKLNFIFESFSGK